jgi:hypothetical protein
MSPSAASDCKAGWTCFWEWENFTGGASSAVTDGHWNVPANLVGKVSSVWNNSDSYVNVYSHTCTGWIELAPHQSISALTGEACSDGGTWNNKVDSINRVS